MVGNSRRLCISVEEKLTWRGGIFGIYSCFYPWLTVSFSYFPLLCNGLMLPSCILEISIVWGSLGAVWQLTTIIRQMSRQPLPISSPANSVSVLAQPSCNWPSGCTGVGRRSLKPLGFPNPSLPFLWDNTDPCVRLIWQGGAMRPEKTAMRAGVIMMHNCFPELSWRKLVKAEDVGSLSEVKTHGYASIAHRHGLTG